MRNEGLYIGEQEKRVRIGIAVVRGGIGAKCDLLRTPGRWVWNPALYH